MMSAVKKSLSVAAALAFVVGLIIVLGLIVLYFSIVSHVMTKASPGNTHAAKLYRYQGIDVNFRVYVDGDNVYYSPDFAPADRDFREQIAWSSDGQVVVLIVGGKRLFGYQAFDNRPLTDEELIKVEFTPFDELGYEATLPKQESAE